MSLAFFILFHILIFTVATFGTSLLIERYYRGTLKWVLVPSLTLVSALLITKTDFMLRVLHAITVKSTLHDFPVILLGGVITGVFFSFL
jgi:hypothetical protein